MKRRAFLATILSASAGCVSVGSSSTPTTQPSATTSTTPSDPKGQPSRTTMTTRPNSTGSKITTTTAPTLQGTRKVSVTNISQGELSKLGLSVAVTATTKTITQTHPAKVHVAVTANSTTTIKYYTSPSYLFAAKNQKENNPQMVLDPASASRATGPCWEYPPKGLEMGETSQTKSVKITPNSPFTQSFTIFNHPQTNKCFPTGTYFVHDVFRKNGSQYRWSFDLSVTN